MPSISLMRETSLYGNRQMTQKTRREIVEAGAGCGKTYSLVTRYLEALEKYKASDIWVLTFTKLAAEEMHDKILERCSKQELVRDSKITTFHSHCLSLLTPWLAQLGLSSYDIQTPEAVVIQKKKKHLFESLEKFPKAHLLLDSLELSQILQLGVETWFQVPTKQNLENELVEIKDAILKWEQNLIQCLHDSEKYLPEEWKSLKPNYWPIKLKEYLTTKDLNALSGKKDGGTATAVKTIKTSFPLLEESFETLRSDDFLNWHKISSDDSLFSKELEIQNLLCDFFEFANSSKPKILDFEAMEHEILTLLNNEKERICTPPKVLLVDEFQDTNQRQFDILSKLCDENTEWYFVGDPKQSIYKFRGGDVKLFFKIKKEIANLELNTNYRSEPEVLDFMNQSQSYYFNKDNPFDPHSQTLKPSGKILNTEKKNQKVRILSGISTNKDTIVATAIEEIVLRLKDSQEDQDIAVLALQWNDLIKVSEELDKNGIAHFLHRKENPLDHPLHLIFIDYLRYIHNPNTISLFVYHLQRYESPADWSQLSTDTKKLQLKTSFPQGAWDLWLEHFEDLMNSSRFPDGRVWLSAMDRILKQLMKLGLNNTWTPRDLADNLETKSFSQISDALIWNDAPKENERKNKIQLLTIHASKGLEYDDVILLPSYFPKAQSKNLMLQENDSESVFDLRYRHPNESKKLPSLLYLKKYFQRVQEEDAEKQRLLYVALTRAKRTISILLTKSSEAKSLFASQKTQWAFFKEPNFKHRYWSNVFIDHPLTTPIPELSKDSSNSEDTDDEAPQTPWNLPQKSTPIVALPPFYRVGVSTYINKIKSSDESAGNKPPKHNFSQSELGTYIHSCLEIWDGNISTVPTVLENFPAELRSSLEKILINLRSIPELSEYFNLLQTQPSRIYREWGVFIHRTDARLSGFADVLILPENEKSHFTLIDWKSGASIKSLLSSSRKEKTLEQLKLYASSLNKYTPQKVCLLSVAIDTNTQECALSFKQLDY